ncbi:putative quinol monooxygenase [Burkholderia gladioli]|uniref:putative quinol monooxygenase n=1 Tax=Burkholderia gladioli TaxID=28095 RepID=UPI001640E5D1|nr:putative quinol monooxygenase [Burkholderia gladioli]
MSEIAVVATIIAKPGMEDKLLEQVGTIVGPTRLEAGALQYDLHRDRDDPRRFVFFERWESEAALAAHAQSAHILAYRKAAVDFIDSAEIRVMQRIA